MQGGLSAVGQSEPTPLISPGGDLDRERAGCMHGGGEAHDEAEYYSKSPGRL